MTGFRNMVRAALWKSTTPYIRTVPYELVRMILDLVSVQDRVCFALSCRYLFSCLNAYLKTQKLELRQLFPPEKRVPFCPNVKQRPRIQFLVRLENERWKFCPACWKLHLRSSRGHRDEYYRHRHHLFGLRVTTPYPSEVDLCPCLSISFRDKLELMETCNLVGDITHRGRKYYHNKTFYHPSSGRYLHHDCTFTNHPFAKVQIGTELWYDEESRSLRIHNRYHFETNQKAEGALAYPQTDLMDWLEKFFYDAGLWYLGCPGTGPSPTSFWIRGDLQPTDELGVSSFNMSVIRDLGNAEWPNKSWDNVCRQ